MKRNATLFTGLCLVLAFVVWTILVSTIDVKTIGPEGSSVGFSTLNGYIHDLTGVNMSLYQLTDWLGLVPIGTALGFAILGLIQWIKTKSLLKVDRRILLLGVFYIVVIGAFLLFEVLVINYRPVLIEGKLEASYPSSTTMLTLSVMPSAMIELNSRIKNQAFKLCTMSIILIFTVFMVVARLISGVHWFSDIIGGVLLSAGLVMIYYYWHKAYGAKTG